METNQQARRVTSVEENNIGKRKRDQGSLWCHPVGSAGEKDVLGKGLQEEKARDRYQDQDRLSKQSTTAPTSSFNTDATASSTRSTSAMITPTSFRPAPPLKICCGCGEPILKNTASSRISSDSTSSLGAGRHSTVNKPHKRVSELHFHDTCFACTSCHEPCLLDVAFFLGEDATYHANLWPSTKE
ncbi:unnamed protein product [Amoebophrya sp. A25]|nr:unnamed protein product [Amoebophrya sp. A25]|eukprot:GSA25T00004647001.1